MNYSLATILVVIATSSLVSTTNAVKVGTNICVDGYVMDEFCIKRGTFLDSPTTVTLQDPQLHSFHCLLDVPSCINSDFNVLLDPISSGSLYRPGFVLDEASKANAITLAKSVGSCDDCDNGTNDQDRTLGLRIVMNATITDLTADPPVITVHNMEETADFDMSAMSACQKFYQMDDITSSPDLDLILGSGAGRTTFMKSIPLMMIGWGLSLFY
jgi:hypothetical protein